MAKGRPTWGEMTRSTRLVLVVHGGVVLACLSVLVWPAMREAWMGVMHLRAGSYVAWAMLQPMPRMYFGANESWMSDEPLQPAQRDGRAALPPDTEHLWLNHNPTREAIVHARHWYEVSEGERLCFEVRTRYRGADVMTRYWLRPVASGVEQRAMVMEREDTP